VRQHELCAASAGCGLVEQVELETHLMILAGSGGAAHKSFVSML
jgi:hypothetical protein